MRSGPILFAAAAAALLAAVLVVLLVKTPRPPNTRTVRVLALGTSGRWLAAGTSEGEIYACESTDQSRRCLTFRAEGNLNDMRFSERNELFIADKNIRLVDLDGGQPVRQVRSDGANYGAVRFGFESRTILTIDGHGAVMTIDLNTGDASPLYCCSSIWGDVDFTDQGRRVIWAGHWPGVWDLRKGKLAGRFTTQREFMAFGPIAIDPTDGLAYMGSQDGRVYQWKLGSHELLSKSAPLSEYVMTIAVLGTSGWIAYAAQPGVVHLWHPKTGATRVVRTARSASNIVFDRMRGLAGFGTESGAIEFWDLLQGRMLDTTVVSSPR